ncbi:unnamed protein product [Heligmosomoides polygyrus]|uniref:Uncharacterized protein n=1 Tax=Heligmosomoides polygyrus TaxID=6339 RepID=A0A183FPG7_HELPZ|nr:unnamed protein product [Heligmosomoides polygyrus]
MRVCLVRCLYVLHFECELRPSVLGCHTNNEILRCRRGGNIRQNAQQCATIADGAHRLKQHQARSVHPAVRPSESEDMCIGILNEQGSERRPASLKTRHDEGISRASLVVLVLLATFAAAGDLVLLLFSSEWPTTARREETWYSGREMKPPPPSVGLIKYEWRLISVLSSGHTGRDGTGDARSSR